jgi:hypothetical protein
VDSAQLIQRSGFSAVDSAQAIPRWRFRAGDSALAIPRWRFRTVDSAPATMNLCNFSCWTAETIRPTFEA